MDILYVAHCVPWPPDNGQRIRAFHSLSRLARHHRVHLTGVARSEQEVASASILQTLCASMQFQILDRRRAFVRGLLRFAAGQCFNTAYYSHPELHAYIESILRRFPIGAAIIVSSPMALYTPRNVPFIADWGDVDSEKWFQYARARFPSFPQRLEARRLRKIECEYALRSRRTFLITSNELQLFRSIVPEAPLDCSGNGVDFDFFDPAAVDVPDELRGRKFLAFTGVLSYFPNSDGVIRFAEAVFPELRRRDPDLELFLVGRNPTRGVIRLAQKPGITVTGTVDDVRPYLAAARAVIAPLRIARGLQNKVLEALAMGKKVLASEDVCGTFRPHLPTGLVCCQSVDDYVRAVATLPATSEPDAAILEATRMRYTWDANLDPLIDELDRIAQDIGAEALA
jgi:sugar transferase (PEP-CTERM/EpsH1 system associated)